MDADWLQSGEAAAVVEEGEKGERYDGVLSGKEEERTCGGVVMVSVEGATAG